ncbi:hypothetical protein [Nocardia fluminea]|uniref:hypothetical protein n=1 Tax=Nocardia fluminea TaxID=134984 RepID=UPI00364CB2A8
MNNTGGVHITGHVTATGSAIAGESATVTNNTVAGETRRAPADAAEFRSQLHELVRLVQTEAAASGQPGLTGEVELAAEEAASEKPNRRILTVLLTSAAEALAGIGTLAAFAGVLRDAVDTAFGG